MTKASDFWQNQAIYKQFKRFFWKIKRFFWKILSVFEKNMRILIKLSGFCKNTKIFLKWMAFATNLEFWEKNPSDSIKILRVNKKLERFLKKNKQFLKSKQFLKKIKRFLKNDWKNHVIFVYYFCVIIRARNLHILHIIKFWVYMVENVRKWCYEWVLLKIYKVLYAYFCIFCFYLHICISYAYF